MPYSEAHRRADARYKSRSTTQVGLRFYNATEGDLIAHLARQPNKQGYLKRLIREDMEREAEREVGAQDGGERHTVDEVMDMARDGFGAMS